MLFRSVLKALGASRLEILWNVGLPRTLPYFFASLKVAVTLAFVGTVLSETVAANKGIGNAMLETRGVDFITAFRGFLDFVGSSKTWAFGRDDLIFAANLKLYGWSGLAAPPYENALPWFAAHGVDLKGKHACDVPEAVGLTFEGHKHDALADAKGVAAGMAHLIRQGAPNPFLAGNAG